MNRPTPWFERPTYQPHGRQTLRTWPQPSTFEQTAPVALMVITGIAMGFALAAVVGGIVIGFVL